MRKTIASVPTAAVVGGGLISGCGIARAAPRPPGPGPEDDVLVADPSFSHDVTIRPRTQGVDPG